MDRKTKYDSLGVVRASWSAFVVVGFFSFFVNLGFLASPFYMQQVFDRVLHSRHLETLLYLSLITVFFLAVVAILDGLRGRILAKIARWWDETVHGELLAVLIQTARARGSAPSFAINDLLTVRQFVGSPSVLPFFDAPFMPLYLAAIALIHPLLGLVAASTAALLIALAAVNDLRTRAMMRSIGPKQAGAQALADTATRHADSTYSMGMLPGVLKRFEGDNQYVVSAMHDVAAFTAYTGATSKFLRLGAQVAIMGFGAYLAIDGTISSGSMIAASIIMSRALAPAEQAMGAWRGFVSARAAQARLKALTLAAPFEVEKPLMPAPRGRVDFENATYMVPGSEKPLLRNLSMSVPAGTVVGVVGPSGSGKSTFCRLLIGALSPTSGSVRIDTIKHANWNRAQLSEHVGYLPQTVDLFSGTIIENIARFSEASDEEVVAACQIAGCHEMICRLPDGYNTVIGDGGHLLSGGQKQRIGLARAVFRTPKLLVLDEPNSNLDTEGESALAAAVTELKESGSTVFIVSHRASAMAFVDQIVTIKDGAVERTQTREEAMKAAMRPVESALGEIKRLAAEAQRRDKQQSPAAAAG